MELLRFGQINFVACESIVYAECEQCHLLCDYHQWSGYVQCVRSIIETSAMQVHHRQIDHRYDHHQAAMRFWVIFSFLCICVFYCILSTLPPHEKHETLQHFHALTVAQSVDFVCEL